MYADAMRHTVAGNGSSGGGDGGTVEDGAVLQQLDKEGNIRVQQLENQVQTLLQIIAHHPALGAGSATATQPPRTPPTPFASHHSAGWETLMSSQQPPHSAKPPRVLESLFSMVVILALRAN
jgi:hypothetical protein